MWPTGYATPALTRLWTVYSRMANETVPGSCRTGPSNLCAASQIRNVREKSPKPKKSTPMRKIQNARGNDRHDGRGALSETEAPGRSRSLVRKKIDAAASRPGTKVHKMTVRNSTPPQTSSVAISGPATAPSISPLAPDHTLAHSAWAVQRPRACNLLKVRENLGRSKATLRRDKRREAMGKSNSPRGQGRCEIA